MCVRCALRDGELDEVIDPIRGRALPSKTSPSAILRTARARTRKMERASNEAPP